LSVCHNLYAKRAQTIRHANGTYDRRFRVERGFFTLPALLFRGGFFGGEPRTVVTQR